MPPKILPRKAVEPPPQESPDAILQGIMAGFPPGQGIPPEKAGSLIEAQKGQAVAIVVVPKDTNHIGHHPMYHEAIWRDTAHYDYTKHDENGDPVCWAYVWEVTPVMLELAKDPKSGVRILNPDGTPREAE